MDALTAKKATGYFYSIALIGGGLRAILDPVAQAEFFGPQISSPSSPATPYLTAMGGRNIAFGALIGALMWGGDRRTTGLVFYSAVAITGADALANWRWKQEWTGAFWSHFVSFFLCPAIGWWMRN